MNILHDICSDNGVQISLHKIEDKINIFVILCFEYVLKGNDIGMTIELLKEDDLCYLVVTYR